MPTIIECSLLAISSIAIIVGAVKWNAGRLSLWRISVSSLGLLYAVFA